MKAAFSFLQGHYTSASDRGQISAVARILAVIMLSCKVKSPTCSASNEGLHRFN
jgi:hypothetical protein